MSAADLTLTRYYALVDAGHVERAMSLVDAGVRFSILLPGGAKRGENQNDLADYLAGRGQVVRRHLPLRTAVCDDLEFVYGAVVEGDATTTGHFLASVRINQSGLIAAYKVAFDPELALLPPE